MSRLPASLLVVLVSLVPGPTSLAFGGGRHQPTPASARPEPAIPLEDAVRRAVGRPEFVLAEGATVRAGTAFIASMDGGAPMLLSALHLLGEAGGLDEQIPAAQIQSRVRAVHLYDMNRGTVRASAAVALLREGYPLRGSDCAGDIVAFRMAPACYAAVLPLARSNPAVGQRVFVAGALARSGQTVADLHAAEVTQVRPSALEVRLDDAMSLRAYSGAPVLNEAGEVVGMVIGGGESETTVLLNPVRAMRSMLAVTGAH